MKKYCLLKDGSIESCFYKNGEPRDIYKEKGKWYLDYDIVFEDGSIYLHSEIVKFADSKEELE